MQNMYVRLRYATTEKYWNKQKMSSKLKKKHASYFITHNHSESNSLN